MNATPGRCRLCTTFGRLVLRLEICGVLDWTCVRNEVTRCSARLPPTARSCPSEPAGCLSDLKCSKPACTCLLVPASRRGRSSPRAVAMLQAHASRTPVKITSATFPRAPATAIIVGERRCARARQVIDDNERCARELATSFIADEQRSARANPRARAAPVGRPALPRGIDPRRPARVALRPSERRPRRALPAL